MLLLLILLFIINSVTKTCALAIYSPGTITGSATYGNYKFNVAQHLAAISLYFETNSEGLSPDPPPGCIVDKAVYQVRHGAIYANEYDYVHTIEPFLQRLKNSSGSADFSDSEALGFLSKWTSPITNSEEQVAKVSKLGYYEAFSFGTRLVYRYPHLMPTQSNESFNVWVSDSNRTRRSAEALFSGIHGGHDLMGTLVVVSEDKGRGADSLTPTKTCPKFDVTAGTKEAETWLFHYSRPIIARLSANVSGFIFSPLDILAMQELCGYETIIRGSSPFCGVFTPEEWLSFEYYFDVKYYYEMGYGSDLSASLGMPWVLAANNLLTDKTDGNQHLYISVAHRQIPPLIVTALGLFNDPEYRHTTDHSLLFPFDQVNHQRAWRTSNFMSFLGQIALERLNCKSTAYTGSFIRAIVGSTPKPLHGCASGPGASCPLKQFDDYIKRRVDKVKTFSKACGLENKNATDELTFFWRKDFV